VARTGTPWAASKASRSGPGRPLRAVEGDDDVEVVGQAGGDPVSRPDAQLPQGARSRAGEPVEVRVGQRAGRRDQRGRVRPVPQRGAEHLGDRLGHSGIIHDGKHATWRWPAVPIKHAGP
jgi:hypothetical protein